MRCVLFLIFGSFGVALGEGTGAVGLQQAAQILGLSLNGAAHIRLADLHTVFHVFKDQRVVGDVMVAENGGLFALKGLVGNDADAAGILMLSAKVRLVWVEPLPWLASNTTVWVSGTQAA